MVHVENTCSRNASKNASQNQIYPPKILKDRNDRSEKIDPTGDRLVVCQGGWIGDYAAAECGLVWYKVGPVVGV